MALAIYFLRYSWLALRRLGEKIDPRRADGVFVDYARAGIHRVDAGSFDNVVEPTFTNITHCSRTRKKMWVWLMLRSQSGPRS